MTDTSYETRQQMTFKAALEEDIFFVECCSGCGKENCRLYVQAYGMYHGNRYCRSCAVAVLKQEAF